MRRVLRTESAGVLMPGYILRDLDPKLWQLVKIQSALDGRSLKQTIQALFEHYTAKTPRPKRSADGKDGQ